MSARDLAASLSAARNILADKTQCEAAGYTTGEQITIAAVRPLSSLRRGIHLRRGRISRDVGEDRLEGKYRDSYSDPEPSKENEPSFLRLAQGLVFLPISIPST